MLFYDFKKSQEAEQATEQFPNFMDRDFTLAVKVSPILSILGVRNMFQTCPK